MSLDHSQCHYATMVTDSLLLRSESVTVGSSFSGSIFWQVSFVSASLLSVYTGIHSALYKCYGLQVHYLFPC